MLSDWLSVIALIVTLVAWFGIKPSDFGRATRKYVFKSRYTVFFSIASLVNLAVLVLAILNNTGLKEYSIYLWGVAYLSFAYLNSLIPSSRLVERVYNVLQGIFPIITLLWAFGILQDIFNSENLTQIINTREFWISIVRAGFFIFLAGFMAAGNVILGFMDKRVSRLTKKIEALEEVVVPLETSQTDKSK